VNNGRNPRRPKARPEDVRALYRALVFVGALFIGLFFNAL
jgi:hypothetical protein